MRTLSTTTAPYFLATARAVAVLLFLSILCVARSPNADPSQRISFTIKANVLEVNLNSKRTIIKSVYESKEKTTDEKWEPEKLLSPDRKRLLVPMADFSYRLYAIKGDTLELENIIEGGTFSGVPHSYWRTRMHWNFIGWTEKGEIKLFGDVGPEGYVSAIVDVDAKAFQIKESSGETDPLLIRCVTPDREVEMRFIQRK
jgi:hypothetical protein